jgi:Family of unknown function (DUF6496)
VFSSDQARFRYGTGNLLQMWRLLEVVLNASLRQNVGERQMAQRRKRRYSRSVGKDVESEMRRYKAGTARSGRGGRGGKVKSRKQAIAIALSEARKKGKRLPKKK